jgi:hypothetical protein
MFACPVEAIGNARFDTELSPKGDGSNKECHLWLDVHLARKVAYRPFEDG